MFRGANCRSQSCSYKRATVFAAFALILLCSYPSLAQAPQTQTSSELQVLETGKPLERRLAGGAKQSYRVELSDNQYAKVVIEQRGIDLVVRLFDSDNKMVSEFDSAITLRGSENAEIFTPVARTYRLEIEARSKMLPRAATRSIWLKSVPETNRTSHYRKRET